MPTTFWAAALVTWTRADVVDGLIAVVGVIGVPVAAIGETLTIGIVTYPVVVTS